MRPLIFAISLWLIAGCVASGNSDATSTTLDSSDEVAIQIIMLSGTSADATREYSSLAWYYDTLILLPQYPQTVVYGIPQAELVAYLDSPSPDAIIPQSIPISGNGDLNIGGFQGYEAIVFAGDTAYLTIEASRGQMQSYVILGTMSETGLELQPETLTTIMQPAQINNSAHEALFLLPDGDVVAIYERVQTNPATSAYNITNQTYLAMPSLPYRLTDATTIDENGNFWVINYLFAGEDRRRDDDPYLPFNLMGSHAIYPHLERLVELHIAEDGTITLSDHAPIYLQLAEEARNWEGIVRLDDRGFLIVTDKFPETVLAFVPFTD